MTKLTHDADQGNVAQLSDELHWAIAACRSGIASAEGLVDDFAQIKALLHQIEATLDE